MERLNAIDLVQSIGIITSLLFMLHQLRDANKLRRFEIFWRIGDSHRETWRPLIDNPKLGEVLKDSEYVPKRLSVEESMFVTTVIVHLENVYRAQVEGFYVIPSNVKQDIAELMALPAFRRAWNESRNYQDSDFVEFIDSLASEDAEAAEA